MGQTLVNFQILENVCVFGITLYSTHKGLINTSVYITLYSIWYT
jgi:hypothetical protein